MSEKKVKKLKIEDLVPSLQKKLDESFQRRMRESYEKLVLVLKKLMILKQNYQ